MSFFWKNSPQQENLPKGVNTQFSSFSRKKDEAKDGYDNQKINYAANIENSIISNLNTLLFLFFFYFILCYFFYFIFFYSFKFI